MKLLLDTGPLVALLNRRDRNHAWALETLDQQPPPLWTCEPVLTEAAYITSRGAEIMAMVAQGAIRIGMRIEDEADSLERLMLKYGERMDLADACVVRLSELYHDSCVLTVDREDFGIYRRNGREVIPLIAPPR